MNEQELALHYLQEYYNTPTHWESYKTIQNAIKENQQLKEQLERSEKAREEAIEYINNELEEIGKHQYAIGTRRLNKIKNILDIDKGE